MKGADPLPTGIEEWDRVLGGGLPPSGLLLLCGEPGVGKSTLALQVAAAACARGPVLYACAEESPQQVGRRAARLGPVPEPLYLSAPSDLRELEAQVRDLGPCLTVVDSIQALSDPDAAAGAGTPGQVRACAGRLSSMTRATGGLVLLVGHVTKDGSVAGPRTLEHQVDAVLLFEGERTGPARVLRALKNRYGSTREIGLFVMEDDGLAAVADPSAAFRARRDTDVPGSVLAVPIEGQRPILLEIQALTVPSSGAHPERRASGLDPARLPLLLAVLERHAAIPASRADAFVNVVGGLRPTDRTTDLAVLLAVASAQTAAPFPRDAVAIGEVGLTGEVVRCPGIGVRLAEARRLGCTWALVPEGTEPVPGIRTQTVGTVAQAVRRLLERPGPAAAAPSTADTPARR